MPDPVNFQSNLRSPYAAQVRGAFIHARPIPRHPNPQGHLVLCDPEIFDGCGYVSQDEGEVLHACARAAPGEWLEIGPHTGWSSAHIACAPEVTRLTCVEPEFKRVMFNKTGQPALFADRFNGNLERTGHRRKVGVFEGTSDEYFEYLRGPGAANRREFSGAFIDGEHEPPFPERDAQGVLPLLAPDACVVFHDALGWPVQHGARVFIEAGFKWRLYMTPQLMIVCWRGNFAPPSHTGDVSFNWPNWIHSCLRFDLDLSKQS